MLGHEAHETVEGELGAPVADAHRALEAQEFLRIPLQLGGSDDGAHVGIGNESSLSDSVAILT